MGSIVGLVSSNTFLPPLTVHLVLRNVAQRSEIAKKRPPNTDLSWKDNYSIIPVLCSMVRLPHSTSPFSLDSNTRSEEMTEKCKEGKKEGAKEANSVETFSSEGRKSWVYRGGEEFEV